MVDPSTPDPISIEAEVKSLREGNCPFLVRDHILNLLLYKRVGRSVDHLDLEKDDPDLAWAEKRVPKVIGWLQRDVNSRDRPGAGFLETIAWLSGADVRAVQLFPKNPGSDIEPSSLPDALHDQLVEVWQTHPGHAKVKVYVNPSSLDFMTAREQVDSPRSEPLACWQSLMSKLISDIQTLERWEGFSEEFIVQEEARDRFRYVAIANYERDGRKVTCAVPMVGYWHMEGLKAREADRKAVMGFLDGLYTRCKANGRGLEIYAPGAIPKLKDRKQRRTKRGKRHG